MELAASESGLPKAELLKAATRKLAKSGDLQKLLLKAAERQGNFQRRQQPKAATTKRSNYQKRQLPKEPKAATTERGYFQKRQLLRAASAKNGT